MLGDLETVIGFGLAGVGDLHVGRTREENLQSLKKMLEDPEMGIIFVTAPIAEELHVEKLRKNAFPIIIVIPDAAGRRPKVDPTERAIARTLGSKIVIREGA